MLSSDEVTAFHKLLEQQLAEPRNAGQTDDTGKGRCWPHYALTTKLFSEYLKKVIPLNNRQHIA